MPYSIDFQSEALEDLKSFRRGDQVRIIGAIEIHLKHGPTRQSKSRIKHLRPGTRPPVRLRVDEARVYYDVDEESQTVTIYGSVDKNRSHEWLATFAGKFEDRGHSS